MNENGPSINDTANDKTSDNSGDFDYIGGITDKPKDYIHNDGTGDSDGGHSGGGGHGGGRGDNDTSFIPSSSWTLSDFVNWVKMDLGYLETMEYSQWLRIYLVFARGRF